MAKNDGGPAFPLWKDMGSAHGMTLRDYFAAAALTALIADPEGPTYLSAPKEAYKIADAMLAERGKG